MIDRRRDDPDQNNNNRDQYIFEFFECESSTRLLLFPGTGHDKTEETLEKYTGWPISI